MQTTKPPPPDAIIQACNSMLAPYGLDFSIISPENKEPLKKYLSTPEAEEYTSVSRWTLHRAIKAGALPIIKLSKAKSGKVLFDKNDLDEWLQALKGEK